jgi:glycosyltransferase involved in cell wall biosynthesis
LRVAIVHYWLIGMRGGERVLEALCQLLPDADVFTLFYEPERVSPTIRAHKVHTSFLNPFRRFHRHTLPLMPIALEHFDLRSYDLVISSESGPAKGVITSSNTRHVCYCHSPMRYLWDLYPAYLHEWIRSPVRRASLALCANYLRLWDYSAAARVDDFLANSANVQRRIWKAYRRSSEVVYPPVHTESFYHRSPDDYFLLVSELVEYKRVCDAVTYFSRTGQSLKIVGEGPQYRVLKSLARSNVEFCGRVSETDLRDLYARCRALVFPGEEDFGIVPVEALASGKAVIALGLGGVLESVPVTNPSAGFFYHVPGPEHLGHAIKNFEAGEVHISPIALQHAARRFSTARFMTAVRGHLGIHAVSGAALGAKEAK